MFRYISHSLVFVPSNPSELSVLASVNCLYVFWLPEITNLYCNILFTHQLLVLKELRRLFRLGAKGIISLSCRDKICNTDSNFVSVLMLHLTIWMTFIDTCSYIAKSCTVKNYPHGAGWSILHGGLLADINKFSPLPACELIERAAIVAGWTRDKKLHIITLARSASLLI